MKFPEKYPLLQLPASSPNALAGAVEAVEKDMQRTPRTHGEQVSELYALSPQLATLIISEGQRLETAGLTPPQAALEGAFLATAVLARLQKGAELDEQFGILPSITP